MLKREPTLGLPNAQRVFSLKGQTVNIPGSAGHTVTDVMAPPGHCSKQLWRVHKWAGLDVVRGP